MKPQQSDGMSRIEITEATAHIGRLFGLMKRDGDEFVLTEKGEKWLREYCESVLGEHARRKGDET